MMIFIHNDIRVTFDSESDLPAPIAWAAKIDAAIEIERAGN